MHTWAGAGALVAQESSEAVGRPEALEGAKVTAATKAVAAVAAAAEAAATDVQGRWAGKASGVASHR